jgi:hypothetical protein
LLVRAHGAHRHAFAQPERRSQLMGVDRSVQRRAAERVRPVFEHIEQNLADSDRDHRNWQK